MSHVDYLQQHAAVLSGDLTSITRKKQDRSCEGYGVFITF